MPFDATPTTTTHSLAELSHVLRNKHLWPTGFKWDYGSCTTCAMGLANELWNLNFPYHLQPYWADMTADYFRMSKMEASNIFLYMQMIRKLTLKKQEITPEDVADAIDTYLEMR